MAHILIMPRQGNTVESCVLVAWRVQKGATVGADDVVCEVETDKATFEVPAGAEGVVLELLRAEGDDVPVLEPIAVIGQPGEAWQAGAAAGAAPGGAPSAAVGAEKTTAGPEAAAPAAGSPAGATTAPAASEPQHGVSPRARRLAAAEGVATAPLSGTGPHGRVIERDVRAAVAERPPLTAAARAAVAGGAEVPASGSALGGRAGVADLAAHARAAATTPSAAAAAVPARPGRPRPRPRPPLLARAPPRPPGRPWGPPATGTPRPR